VLDRSETIRRIDTARDILVGKVPDPKSQVEQITIALIYKFMDDMDRTSVDMGGKASFFTGEYKRYGWSKIFAPRLGGHEMLNLYAEAIEKLNQNRNIPQLFRDIFKNAYLPYRDPETLKLFLRTINDFTYDHSENLGDAFEYLLSILGSQGDAGQFRTPRHIIDFMVEVINPQKNETIIDPACGTAGFLISSYKHIMKANTEKKPGDRLSVKERKSLLENFTGYDISPDMVRLSLVNLYLHGFSQPKIFEYDTLTSDERWNSYADVILANPPFMSPKGGIKPHKRFSVQSNRSEVLFVDYIAEHLTASCRSAVIVPEGIIFQSGKAYKQLRKMLVDKYLYAVVSLPAGVFNPYSGVKTSILFFEPLLAQKSDSILFVKVENDGLGLGAQRRTIDKNDLPDAIKVIGEFRNGILNGKKGQAIKFSPSAVSHLVVAKEKIASNGEYNLSGERYRENEASNHNFPLVTLGEKNLFRIESGGTPKSDVEKYWNGGIFWATLVDLPAENFITEITSTQRTISDKGLQDSSAKMIPINSIIVSTRATIGRIAINRIPLATNQGFKNIVIEDTTRIIPEYIAFILTKLVPTMKIWATGGTFAELSKSKFSELQIPLPPLEIQKKIVAEIEGYQKVIDGARQVVENWKPHIHTNPSWDMIELKKIIDELESGVSVNSSNRISTHGEIGILKTSCVTTGIFQPHEHKAVIQEEINRVKCPVKRNSIIISRMNTEALVGANAYVSDDYPNLFLPDRLWQTIISRSDVDVRYVQTILASSEYRQRISSLCGGTSGSMKNISKHQLLSLRIPFPPFEIQQAIADDIKAEQALLKANRELIIRMEKKIQAVLARVWGDS